jgi:hypothetical protein
MDISAILLTFGVPSALFGIVVWYFKRSIEKRDKRQVEQEQNIEQLMLMLMKSNRANSVLCTAIARAVQRIPDAHCNGDMTKALEVVDEYNKEEKDFLMKQGIKHIFE